MLNKKRILITGGSGLIGTRLTKLLLSKGYSVAHLSRSKRKISNVDVFLWDIKKGYIEEGAFDNIDAVIHLAGAGVADKRWNESRRKIIVKSRVDSASLLYNKISGSNHNIRKLISASGISIYGSDTGDTLLTEDMPLGNDFLSSVAQKWELSAKKFNEIGISVISLRIGVVLSNQGGALPKLAQPVRLGLGAPLGTGTQYISWIHIDDLCRLFVHSLEAENMKGGFNAVAPDPVTNKKFTKTLAKILKKPLFLPPIPSFLLKLLLGERAIIVLGGNKASSKKIEQSGFYFLYTNHEVALRSLL